MPGSNTILGCVCTSALYKLMNITIQTNCEGFHHTSEEVRQEVSTASVNCILLMAHSRSMRLEP